jgi:hypothetical protein
VLAVAAPIVLLYQRRTLATQRRVELAALAALMAGLGIASFRWEVPPALVVLPIMAWTAFRLGDVGVTVIGGLFAFVANYMTAAGYGEFADLSVSEDARLAITQAFIAVVILVSWFIALEVDERIEAVRKYDDEHAVATILQDAVLPTLPARLARFDIGTLYLPATRLGSVGGDWYDAIDLPEDRSFFTVGDVVGHGIPAAQDMALLRNATRTLAFEGHSPARLLQQASRLAADTTQGRYATIIAAVFDPVTDAVVCASAGHPPMVVLRSDGEVTITSAPHGPPLGTTATAGYGEESVELAPGDTAVLYSDGLVERPGLSIDAGIARLCVALREWDGAGELDELCRHLVARCMPERERRDDACVLAFARAR